MLWPAVNCTTNRRTLHYSPCTGQKNKVIIYLKIHVANFKKVVILFYIKMSIKFILSEYGRTCPKPV